MISTNGRRSCGRTSLRAVLVAAATLLAALGLVTMGGIAYAQGDTTATAAGAPAIGCTETWTPWVTPSNNQAGASWDANTCEHYIRGDVRCAQSVGGGSAHFYGGWINETLNLISWATCPGSYPVMTDGYAQFKSCATCSITTVHFWPSRRRT